MPGQSKGELESRPDHGTFARTSRLKRQEKTFRIHKCAATIHWRISNLSTKVMAEAYGNRTHQEPLSRPLTGFEDRGRHQPTTRFRGDDYRISQSRSLGYSEETERSGGRNSAISRVSRM
jgi:hypothetical protein